MGGEDWEGDGGGEWDGGLKGEGLGSRDKVIRSSRAPTPWGGEKAWMYIAHKTWTTTSNGPKTGEKGGGGAPRCLENPPDSLCGQKGSSVNFFSHIYLPFLTWWHVPLFPFRPSTLPSPGEIPVIHRRAFHRNPHVSDRPQASLTTSSRKKA